MPEFIGVMAFGALFFLFGLGVGLSIGKREACKEFEELEALAVKWCGGDRRLTLHPRVTGRAEA